jgi:hypothetical protein
MKNLDRLFAGFVAVLASSAPFSGMALADPKAVIELFTSQGCSSCPPADTYLGELAERDDVIALSIHVDYWDYIGWKDTFAKPEHSLRQRAYAKARGDGRVYTPQIVVNGLDHHVGSSRRSVEKVVDASSLPLPIEVSESGGTIRIAIPENSGLTGEHTTVRLVTYSSNATVEIQRGENRGETITYHNVVRTMRPIGMWEGEEMVITLPAREIMGKNIDGCVVMVQEDASNGPGRILGAAVLPWPSS